MAGRMADVVIRIASDTNEFKLDKVKKELAETRVISESLGQALDNARLYFTLAGVSTAAMVLPMILASKAVGTLDSNLKMAAANGDDPRFKRSYDDMMVRVKELAMTYGKSADDISAAVLELAKAGRDYEETFNMLEPITQLAIANNMDVATSVDIMGKAYTLFADRVSGIAELADIVQAAVAASPLDVTDIPSMLEYVGSGASIGGLSPQEFFATAASLSSIAAGFGSTYSTLMSNMMSRRVEMNALLGEDVIGEDLEIKWSRFIALTREIAETDPSKFGELMGLWGTRSARTTQQLQAIADSYVEMMETVTNSTGVLDDASQEAQRTLDSLWGQLKATLLSPLQDQTVVDAMALSLDSLKVAFTSPAFTEGVQHLIMASSVFVGENAGRFVGIVENLLSVVTDLLPALFTMSQSFVDVVSAVSAIPGPMWEMVAVMVVMKKMMPEFILDLIKWDVLTNGLSRNTMYLGGGLAGIFGGLMMVVSSSDPVVKALGAIMVAVGALSAAIWVYNAALAFMNTMANPVAGAAKIALGLAAATAVAGAAGGILLASSSLSAPESYANPSLYGGASQGGGGTTYVDNRTITIYDAGSDDVKDELALNNQGGGLIP